MVFNFRLRLKFVLFGIETVWFGIRNLKSEKDG